MTQYLQTKTDLFAAAVSHAGISALSSYWGEGYWGYDIARLPIRAHTRGIIRNSILSIVRCSMLTKSIPLSSCFMEMLTRTCLSEKVSKCSWL